MNKKQGGFTLLELLIVVAIIGLLSSLILVGLSSFRTRGRDARRIADIKQVQNGLEIYYTKNLKYPCQGSYSGAEDSWNTLTDTITKAGIGVTQLPQDPLGNGNSYGYATDPNDSNCQSYVLMAKLEDPDNNSLKSDIDDTVYGVDCADASLAYCVQF